MTLHPTTLASSAIINTRIGFVFQPVLTDWLKNFIPISTDGCGNIFSFSFNIVKMVLAIDCIRSVGILSLSFVYAVIT